MAYFNEENDLTDYIDLDLNSESNIIYQLQGLLIIKILQNLLLFYIKFFDSDEWYEFNDTEVN